MSCPRVAGFSTVNILQCPVLCTPQAASKESGRLIFALTRLTVRPLRNPWGAGKHSHFRCLCSVVGSQKLLLLLEPQWKTLSTCLLSFQLDDQKLEKLHIPIGGKTTCTYCTSNRSCKPSMKNSDKDWQSMSIYVYLSPSSSKAWGHHIATNYSGYIISIIRVTKNEQTSTSDNYKCCCSC